MNAECFEPLYNSDSLKRRVSSLVNRYYKAYINEFYSMAMDKEDLIQELWISVYENNTTDNDNIIHMLVHDIFNLLKSAGREARAFIDIDLSSEDDNVSDHENMASLVYAGKAKYVGM